MCDAEQVPVMRIEETVNLRLHKTQKLILALGGLNYSCLCSRHDI